MTENDSERSYRTIEFTPDFFENLFDRTFSAADRKRILRAIDMLDTNEQHPSLRVHALSGRLQGRWSASVTDEIRLTFRRLPGGRKGLLDCTRHYQR